MIKTGPANDDNGPLAQGREFIWSDQDFSRIKALIYQRAGISLHDGKHAMVYSRISRRLRDTGHESFKSYLDWLEQHDGPEWQEFINALTTNLTAFFREQHHFGIFSERLRKLGASSTPRIWCSAASTGEEPYSIAMTVLDTLGAGANYVLQCSDIDTKVLSTAAAGIYKSENVKGLDSEHLRKYFLKGKGSNGGYVRVKGELQKHIEFFTVNLIQDNWPFREPFDMVFCRNVMIYFDAATQRRVLERIHRNMKPGGLLFVGHAENFTDAKTLFTLRGKTVYERV
jgi:chemotaxis protein methyltransferase CheR